ncbi:hypothetical protein JTE90_016669 [Oedothorax gibbosus]|uniref:Transmembrane protein 186 n=1 Tax=Oedothorax gibbosus TaxID=931172 RepID=A0AAV6V674_9ARAC|nr:hypothetical protein JTE90_016669 [Oedothorax gibbosus]
MYRHLCRLKVLKHINTANILLKNARTCLTRPLSSTSPLRKISPDLKTTNEAKAWKRIYYFPYIELAAFLNRFKLYQTTFTVVAIPVSVAMYNYGTMDLDTVGIVTGCAVLASTTLFLMSGYFRRLIGIIAISEDEKTVKISHLTFWGRRNDVSVPSEDIIPLGDGDCNANDVYVKVRRYSSAESLYLTLKFGKIMDISKFELVFGSLDVIGFRK